MADPTYMIRAIPSNASDNVYCTLLAQSAVHGAMAGHTGFTVASVNGRHAYIPFHVSYGFNFLELLCINSRRGTGIPVLNNKRLIVELHNAVHH